MSSRSTKVDARGSGEASAPAVGSTSSIGVPVVALGASSGGLDALEVFFRNVHPESGMAFVVATHLSPEHESKLAQILQKCTAMPVAQVTATVAVASGHVYVVAPGQYLTLRSGCLHVSSLNRPPTSGVIDHLFHSVAEARQERAIGIVLAGSGADGTLGMRAIKERGGLLLAQDPDEAEYAEMPRSIIATGLVDVILPTAEMPARLLALGEEALRPARPAEQRAMPADGEQALQEMQSRNEELTTANQELASTIEEHRRVNDDLHALIENTHLATLVLDQQLNIVLYTLETAKLFNLLPVDIGRPLEHLSHRLAYADVLRDARRVLEDAAEVRREVQDEGGSWYAMRAMPYATSDGPAEGVVLTFADITAQKAVEQVGADRFSLAFHAGPMAASIVTREDGCFLDVNEHFGKITGYGRDEVAGQPARAFGLFFGDDVESPSKDRPGDPALDEVEVRIRTKSGAARDLVVSTTTIDFEGQPCFLSLFYDVTERKRLEREILLVSDREQRRIGVDLHDGLGTHLTGVAMMARGLARNLRAGRTVTAEEMEEIARLLGDGIEQARTLAQGLNPFLLEVRGLTIALRELAANLETQTGIKCSFEEAGGGMALSSEQSMHLYRIAQEALTNAARHAQPNRIRIALARKDHRYRLKIEDDGTGFQPSKREDDRASGMGLSIMRYRAEMIGARLHVVSRPGEGTTITCTFRTTT